MKQEPKKVQEREKRRVRTRGERRETSQPGWKAVQEELIQAGAPEPPWRDPSREQKSQVPPCDDSGPISIRAEAGWPRWPGL